VKKEDALIICGDFGIGRDDAEMLYRYGGIWPGIILFIDGNHENFDFLDSLPAEEWKGGNIHKISDRIYHLMRGQVFEIEGKKIFTMGGNATQNKRIREDGIAWQPQEIIGAEDVEEGKRNLARCDGKVNIIVTHCAPVKILQAISSKEKSARFLVNEESEKITGLLEETEYDGWYVGHYHTDKRLGKTVLIFNDILKII
jgi:hypothetical protein